MKKKIIIFGCGFHGRAVYRNCIKKKIYKIVCWIDNDFKKENKILFKKKIFNPKKINKIRYDYIIFSGRNIKEQIQQVKKITKKRNFKFWGNTKIKPTKTNIKKRNEKLKIILKDVLNKLENNNIPYWVDLSSLLTIFRKENLSIRSDFDISVDFKYLKTIFKLFKKNNKYHVNKNESSKIKKIFFKSKNNIFNFEPAVLDIVFKIFNKKTSYIYNYGNYKKKFPRKYFVGYEELTYSRIKMRIPKNSIQYLKYLYGNWKKKVEFYDNPLAKKFKY